MKAVGDLDGLQCGGIQSSTIIPGAVASHHLDLGVGGKPGLNVF